MTEDKESKNGGLPFSYETCDFLYSFNPPQFPGKTTGYIWLPPKKTKTKKFFTVDADKSAEDFEHRLEVQLTLKADEIIRRERSEDDPEGLTEKRLVVEDPYPTLRDIVQKKDEVAKWHGWAQSTTVQYVRRLENYVLTDFGDCHLDEFTLELADKLVVSAAYKKSMRNLRNADEEDLIIDQERFRNILYRFLEYGTLGYEELVFKFLKGDRRKAGKMPYDPFINQSRKRFQRRSIPFKKECMILKRVIEALSGDDAGKAAGMAIMFFTGIRPAECCGMYQDNIIREAGCPPALNVNRQYSDESPVHWTTQLKTSHAKRLIPLSPMLDEILRYTEVHGFFHQNFPLVWGKYPADRCSPDVLARYISDMIRQDYKIRELPEFDEVTESLINKEFPDSLYSNHVRAYMLRHTFNTRLSARGLEERKLSYLMGHSLEPLKIPDIYKKCEFYCHPECQNEMLEVMRKREEDIKTVWRGWGFDYRPWLGIPSVPVKTVLTLSPYLPGKSRRGGQGLIQVI